MNSIKVQIHITGLKNKSFVDRPCAKLGYMDTWIHGYLDIMDTWILEEHSVEEVLERPTGYPKVGGSNHGSGDFSLQPQRNPYLS